MIQCWPNPAGHPEAFVKSSIFQIDLRLFSWMYAKPVRASTAHLVGLKVDNYRFRDLSSFCRSRLRRSANEKSLISVHLSLNKRRKARDEIAVRDYPCGRYKIVLRWSRALGSRTYVHRDLPTADEDRAAITFWSPCTSVFLFERTSLPARAHVFIRCVHVEPVHVQRALAYVRLYAADGNEPGC